MGRLLDALHERGFMIDPCAGYTKGRANAGGDASEEASERAWAHRDLPGVTGHSVVLREQALLCLDFDPSLDTAPRHEEVWDLFFPDCPIPSGASVVRTPNAGLHVWLRDCPGAELAGLRRVGGVRLDIIRFEGGISPNIVLPGSLVRNRRGQLVRYDLVQPGGFGNLIAGDSRLVLPETPDEILRFLSTS